MAVEHLDTVSERVDQVLVIPFADADDAGDSEAADLVAPTARIVAQPRQRALVDDVGSRAVIAIRVAEIQDAIFRPHMFPERVDRKVSRERFLPRDEPER